MTPSSIFYQSSSSISTSITVRHLHGQPSRAHLISILELIPDFLSRRHCPSHGRVLSANKFYYADLYPFPLPPPCLNILEIHSHACSSSYCQYFLFWSCNCFDCMSYFLPEKEMLFSQLFLRQWRMWWQILDRKKHCLGRCLTQVRCLQNFQPLWNFSL